MIHEFKQEILSLGRIPYIGKLQYKDGDFTAVLYHLKTEIFNKKMPEDILTGRIHVYATCEFSENDYIVISNGYDVNYFIIKNDEMVEIGGKYEILQDYISRIKSDHDNLLHENDTLKKAINEESSLQEFDIT